MHHIRDRPIRLAQIAAIVEALLAQVALGTALVETLLQLLRALLAVIGLRAALPVATAAGIELLLRAVELRPDVPRTVLVAELARVELSENISRAALGLGLIVGGSVLLIPALVILLEAAVAALEQNGMRPAAAAGIIGGVALVLGFILIAIGVSRLRVKSLMPNKTIQQVQRDAATAKQQMRRDYESQRAA